MIRNHFWIKHPEIIKAALVHWIISGIDVPISHRWYLVAFSMSYWWPPFQAKPEENYQKLTMSDCFDLCDAYIKSKTQAKKEDKYDLKGDEKYRKYAPTIAVVRSSLRTVDHDITDDHKKAYVLQKMVDKMKYDQTPMHQLQEMISVLLVAKKDLAQVLREEK